MRSTQQFFALTLLVFACAGMSGCSWIGLQDEGEEKEQSVAGIIGTTVEASSGIAGGMPRPEGALVTKIVPSSPAAEAGIEPGDIIQSVNNRQVRKFEELNSIAQEIPIGSDATITLLRGKRFFRFNLRF